MEAAVARIIGDFKRRRRGWPPSRSSAPRPRPAVLRHQTIGLANGRNRPVGMRGHRHAGAIASEAPAVIGTGQGAVDDLAIQRGSRRDADSRHQGAGPTAVITKDRQRLPQSPRDRSTSKPRRTARRDRSSRGAGRLRLGCIDRLAGPHGRPYHVPLAETRFSLGCADAAR